MGSSGAAVQAHPKPSFAPVSSTGRGTVNTPRGPARARVGLEKSRGGGPGGAARAPLGPADLDPVAAGARGGDRAGARAPAGEIEVQGHARGLSPGLLQPPIARAV